MKKCKTGVKKMSFSKGNKTKTVGKVSTYAEGVKGIFSKKRQEESDIDATAIDAGDAILKQVETPKSTISSVAVKPKKMNLLQKLKTTKADDEEANDIDNKEAGLTIDKSAKSVGPSSPKLEAEDARNSYEASQKLKTPTSPIKDTSNEVNSKMKTVDYNVSDAKLAQWQRKHGLEADGIWGEKSKAKYAELQKSKKMNFGKVNNATSADKANMRAAENKDKSTKPDASKTTTVTKSSTIATPISSDAQGNKYFSNGRMMTKEGKMQNGKTPAKEVSNPSDTARELEYMYPDPELHGSPRVNDRATAKKLVAIDKKGEEETLSTGAKLGIGAGLVGAAAGAYALAKHHGGKMKLKNNFGKLAQAGEEAGEGMIKPKAKVDARTIKTPAPGSGMIKPEVKPSALANKPKVISGLVKKKK